MAADSYVQAAIAQLQNAVVDIQNQLNNARRTHESNKQDHLKQLNHLEQERRQHTMELSSAQDSTERRTLEQRINDINRECDSHKAEVSKIESALASDLASKQAAHDAVQGMIGQLNGLLTSADLRG